MKTFLLAVAASTLAAGCISTDMGPTASSQGTALQASRPTGSNIARVKRDPDLEGWRQGMGREEMERIQRAQGLKMD
jgi:hypothetical protein